MVFVENCPVNCGFIERKNFYGCPGIAPLGIFTFILNIITARWSYDLPGAGLRGYGVGVVVRMGCPEARPDI